MQHASPVFVSHEAFDPSFLSSSKLQLLNIDVDSTEILQACGAHGDETWHELCKAFLLSHAFGQWIAMIGRTSLSMDVTGDGPQHCPGLAVSQQFLST